MPRWTIALRPLAYRQPFEVYVSRQRCLAQWHCFPFRFRNYSTALEPNQQDDTIEVPSSSAVEALNLDSQSQEPSDGSSEQYSPEACPRLKGITRAQKRVLQNIRRGIWSNINPYTLARVQPFKGNKRTKLRQWSYWQLEYSRITTFYAHHSKQHRTRSPRIRVPCLQIEAAEWAESILAKLDDGQTTIATEEMRTVDEEDGRIAWEQVALWLLTYEPKRMVQFLLATHTQHDLETHYIEDSLLHLARYFKHYNDATNVQRLADAFCDMVEGNPSRQFAFTNPFIRYLMQYCSDDQIHRIFRTICDYDVQLHAYTWLHFTTYFANNDHFELALDTLLKAHKCGARLDDFAFRSNCTTVLRRSSQQPDGLRVCLRVVSSLVDIGVTFNLPICNTIMLNAIEAGDQKTAFDVYHSLMERGLKPDEVTFLVLLKGCLMDIDDVNLLNEVIRDAITNINVRQSESVAVRILHCLALHHSKNNPHTALSTLAEAYAQLFDVTPLRKLDLPISPTLQPTPSADLMQPNTSALTFMIGATINHYLTTAPTASPKTGTNQILALYTRWRTHVEDENGSSDPALAALAVTDHLANAFLSAFIRQSHSLLHAARVVRDMQRPLSPRCSVIQSKPTVQTWSIFLHGFTKHKQMKFAEQVLAYMRKQGIEPNQVTWYTLISGYARGGEEEKAIEVLRETQREGIVWDSWTHGGLERLTRARKVQKELRAQRVARRMDFGEELRSGLGLRFGEAPMDSPNSLEDAQRRREEESEDDMAEGFGSSPGELAEQEEDYRPYS